MIFRSVRVELPVLPGRRSLAWTSPPCAPESRLSAEERRNGIPGALRLGVAGAKVPASREQASEIRASLPFSSDSLSLSETT